MIGLLPVGCVIRGREKTNMNQAERVAEQSFEASSEEILDLAEEHLAAGRIEVAEALFAAQIDGHEVPATGAPTVTSLFAQPRGQPSSPERCPTSGERALMGIAHCAVQRECYHEALGYLQALQATAPHYPSLANDMGVIYYRLGLVDEARRSFDEAIVDDAGHLEAWRNLLGVALAMRDVDTCVEASQRVLSMDPADDMARSIVEAAQDDLAG